MNNRSQCSFLTTYLHPSWQILCFAIGVIISCVIVLIIRPRIFTSIVWIILSIFLLIVALLFSKAWMLVLTLISSFLLIDTRAGPDFMAQEYFQNLVGHTVTITGKVAKDPAEPEKSTDKYNIDLVDLQIDGSAKLLPGHLFSQVYKADIQRSDIITLRGEVSDSFGSYYATLFNSEIINIARPEPGDIFLTFRNIFANGVKQYIPATEAGLGIGYLLGQKTGVDSDLQNTLQTVGLTHIIVASGAHLSTLVGTSRKIFGKISRFASLLTALLLMLLFLGITGLSASIIRASLVTGLSLFLWYYGHQIHPARLIIIVAAATLIYNPFYLTDLSWLLSFAAFSGIMILSPILTRIFYGQKKPGFLSNTLLSSIATTLTCTPILLFFFGQVSIISVLANILILPTISIAMYLTFLTG